MENAARGLFDAVKGLLKLNNVVAFPNPTVLIVCGGGNNGGDGYALARHLHNAGHNVQVAATKPVDELHGDAATNAQVAARMNVAVSPATPELIASSAAALLVDALLGTGLTEPPRDDAAELIRAMNAHAAPTLAVDVPSGLDADAGRPLGPAEHCVRAAATATFVAEKVGFPRAAEWLGEVRVVDIGCPRAAIERARRVL